MAIITPQPPQQQEVTSGPFAPPATTASTTPPPAPVVPPETQMAIQSAEKAVADAQKISSEELSTQADLDRLIDSTKKAFQNTRDQAIPMGFITGQLQSIENRALNLAEPLERKLARLQAARLSSLESSKFALDRADKKAEQARSLAERKRSTDTFVDESGNVILFDTQTGEQIRNLGQQFGETDEGDFTLSPGQVRFDAQGNVIATGGEKPLSEAQITKNIEKAEARQAAESEVLSNLNLVNRLLNLNTDAISGIPSPSAFIPGTKAQEAKNVFDQVRAILSIDRREKMKGSGAISDFEAKTLERSASALGRNLSDKAFRRELKQIRGVFATAAGNEAPVIITKPNGESFATSASRQEIDEVIRQGGQVIYD